IDFEEFLGMYKRLFLQCRSVVSGDVADIISPTHKKRDISSSSGFSAKGASTVNSVEAKNQRNLEKSAPPLPSTPPPTNARNGRKNSIDDLLGDDPFFDDLVPSSGGFHSFSNRVWLSHSGVSMVSVEQDDWLTVYESDANTMGSKGKDSDPSLRSLDRRMADLGIGNDMQDDFEYEDDFQSSGHSLSQKSPRSKGEGRDKTENGSDGLPVINLCSMHSLSQKSPRSKGEGRDKTENGSIAEEIEDEEIEDISIEADDLLKSENSGFDDMTTDRSISQMDGGFDYMEDPQLP
ncbi:hypothetical protein BaRGS_00029850, partial [Batillaria attramentaria]